MKIKDWNKFQHFKDRRPPWIKLYRDLLDDPEWHELDPASAKVLVMIWLIASEEMGTLPTIKKLAFRLRMSEKQVEMHCSKLSHWVIQDDITMISNEYQHDAPETETETETETEGEKRQIAPNGFDLFWKAYPKKKAKDDAQKAFAKRKPDQILLDAMLKAIDAQSRSEDWMKDGGKFIPYPATWLNDGRWQDEVQASIVTVPSRPGIDPTLARLKQEEALVKTMPPEIRAKLFG